MVRPLNESQGSSPLQGHGSWLMCEVALSTITGVVRRFSLLLLFGKKKTKKPSRSGTPWYARKNLVQLEHMHNWSSAHTQPPPRA